MPLFLNEGAGADRGLICGYRLEPHGRAREVTADGIVQALAQPDQVTWLHFNCRTTTRTGASSGPTAAC
ncbi:MAG TPA: hypothetical protein VJT10_23875 [Steroidobacteraceae bacterium]|nr:hypothetical protein [Steroidobacteraceae bacterium]